MSSFPVRPWRDQRAVVGALPTKHCHARQTRHVGAYYHKTRVYERNSPERKDHGKK